MSVVEFGVLAVQFIGTALMGLVLLLAVVLLLLILSGLGRRSSSSLELHVLPARGLLDGIARLLAGWISPSGPRAPPAGSPGSLQPIPISNLASRRRRSRSQNDL
jgi:hypothetical protein